MLGPLAPQHMAQCRVCVYSFIHPDDVAVLTQHPRKCPVPRALTALVSVPSGPHSIPGNQMGDHAGWPGLMKFQVNGCR